MGAVPTTTFAAVSGGLDPRTLYVRALDPEGPVPLDGEISRSVRAVLDEVSPAPQETGDGVIEALVERGRDWATVERLGFRELVEPLEGPERTDAVRCVLLDCAPLALSTGAWLQWVSSAGNAESEWALRALDLYADDIGVGLPGAERAAHYRALLAHHRLAEVEPGMRLAQNTRLGSASFRLPALLLAMSRLPEDFLPELLGADLCLRAVGLPPPLGALAGRELGETEARTLDPGGARTGVGADPADVEGEGQRSGLELSVAAVRALLADPSAVAGGDAYARVARGGAWALREVSRWSAAVRAEVELTRHPDYGVWRLICSRARLATAYHREYELDGRPLAEWFERVDEGPGPFLDALARSPLVRPGKPDRSPLVRGLINERGPMFRVFTEDEVEVLRRWIAGLPERTGERAASDDALHAARHGWNLPAVEAASEAMSHAGAGPVEVRGGGGSAREMYRALLSRRESPELRRYAHAYVTRWLARSRYRLGGVTGLPPERWDREVGLREWLSAAHERRATAGGASPASLPSREALVESTLQLAPLIMIDGGWLQGFTDHRYAASPHGHLLFRTYWDELGNGDRTLNHPRIYRELLSEMGVELPPTDSPEFSAFDRFRDESFDTPVYWLCVSRFPRTFLPEILGLNLAMELSGVGSGYRSAAAALRHHGYSTQFVDLHNTIDNVATGHSAWAVDAIDSYLTDLPLPGPHQEQEVWDRIRLGYRSLDPPRGLAPTLYAALRSRTGRTGRTASGRTASGRTASGRRARTSSTDRGSR